MKVSLKWHEGDRPSFTVQISSAEGKTPFIEIKGCRIVAGPKGEFVSWPATKNEKTGKWWNHVYASEDFAAHVLDMAKATKPAVKVFPQSQPAPFMEAAKGAMDDFSDDIPW